MQQQSSSPEIKRLCSACGKARPSAELLLCSRCKQAYYCDVSCQKQHWHAHRALCQTIGTARKVAPHVLDQESVDRSNENIRIARLILTSVRGQDAHTNALLYDLFNKVPDPDCSLVLHIHFMGDAKEAKTLTTNAICERLVNWAMRQHLSRDPDLVKEVQEQDLEQYLEGHLPGSSGSASNLQVHMTTIQAVSSVYLVNNGLYTDPYMGEKWKKTGNRILITSDVGNHKSHYHVIRLNMVPC